MAASCCCGVSTRSGARCWKRKVLRHMSAGERTHEDIPHRSSARRRHRARGDRAGLALDTFPVGATGVRAANNPLPPDTRAAVTRSDAVLLGAVGDPALDTAP